MSEEKAPRALHPLVRRSPRRSPPHRPRDRPRHSPLRRPIPCHAQRRREEAQASTDRIPSPLRRLSASSSSTGTRTSISSSASAIAAKPTAERSSIRPGRWPDLTRTRPDSVRPSFVPRSIFGPLRGPAKPSGLGMVSGSNTPPDAPRNHESAPALRASLPDLTALPMAGSRRPGHVEHEKNTFFS